MIILGPKPAHIPANPRSLAADPTVDPLALFMYETIVSAGCETIAQKTKKKGEIKEAVFEKPKLKKAERIQRDIPKQELEEEELSLSKRQKVLK